MSCRQRFSFLWNINYQVQITNNRSTFPMGFMGVWDVHLLVSIDHSSDRLSGLEAFSQSVTRFIRGWKLLSNCRICWVYSTIWYHIFGIRQSKTVSVDSKKRYKGHQYMWPGPYGLAMVVCSQTYIYVLDWHKLRSKQYLFCQI